MLTQDGQSGSLSELMLPAESGGFAHVAPLPSNVRAVESALLFATGLSSLVAIVGPSGYGKTQILKAAASYRKSRGDRNTEVLSAEQFLKLPTRVEPTVPLILDDCQHVISRPRQRLMLRLALERRVRANRAVLLAFAIDKPNRDVLSILPHARSWSVEQIMLPHEEERFQLIMHLAKAEGLNLSPNLIRIMSAKLRGSGRAYVGALRRLKLDQSDWIEPIQILRACGLLDPFFADNPHWDLRHKISKIAIETSSLFPNVNPTELACYAMTRTAALCENSVSQYLSIEPAEVYSHTMRFARLTRTDATALASHHQFIEIVLARLVS